MHDVIEQASIAVAVLVFAFWVIGAWASYRDQAHAKKIERDNAWRSEVR